MNRFHKQKNRSTGAPVIVFVIVLFYAIKEHPRETLTGIIKKFTKNACQVQPSKEKINLMTKFYTVCNRYRTEYKR